MIYIHSYTVYCYSLTVPTYLIRAHINNKLEAILGLYNDYQACILKLKQEVLLTWTPLPLENYTKTKKNSLGCLPFYCGFYFF